MATKIIDCKSDRQTERDRTTEQDRSIPHGSKHPQQSLGWVEKVLNSHSRTCLHPSQLHHVANDTYIECAEISAPKSVSNTTNNSNSVGHAWWRWMNIIWRWWSKGAVPIPRHCVEMLVINVVDRLMYPQRQRERVAWNDKYRFDLVYIAISKYSNKSIESHISRIVDSVGGFENLINFVLETRREFGNQ